MIEGINVPKIRLPQITLCFNPTNISLFKVSRAVCKICLKFIKKTPERSQWRGCAVFIVKFEQIFRVALVSEFEQVNAGLKTFCCRVFYFFYWSTKLELPLKASWKKSQKSPWNYLKTKCYVTCHLNKHTPQQIFSCNPPEPLEKLIFKTAVSCDYNHG